MDCALGASPYTEAMFVWAGIQFRWRSWGQRSAFACLWCICAAAWADVSTPVAADKVTLVIVVGAPGEEEYGSSFAQWAERWEKAARQAEAKLIKLGVKKEGEMSDKDRLQQTLQEESKVTNSPLWLVLIGHGTFDGKEAKFNLRGPDFSVAELATWLEPFRRPVAVINAASSSGPFLNKLSAPGRVVITATRSGHEQNYARFGQYLSEAITDTEADLDKDGQTSLLEGFLTAAHRTSEFYQVEGRLATEHALLDDNGDGLGTPAEWFRGIRAVKKAKDGAPVDGLRAHQFHLIRSEAENNLPAAVRTRRDELELTIAKLRESKSELKEDEYYNRLEVLLLEMAHLYEQGSGASK